MSSPVTITLSQPIPREGGDVDKLSLRKPKAGELRGLRMTDLMQSDVNTMIALVPRISDPCLIEQEVADLEADDFAEVAGTIVGFFMSPAQKALVSQMTGG